MIISGNLVTPIGDSMAHAQIKLTASRTSSSLLKLTSREFTTDEQGFYSIDVPVGRYHVERYDDKLRGWLSVGVLEITNTTEIADLSTLLMVEQTQAPRDQLLAEIESQVANIESTVRTALSDALDDIGVGATFISADENNRLKKGQDGGYYVSDDFIPDPLAHYILAKG